MSIMGFWSAAKTKRKAKKYRIGPFGQGSRPSNLNYYYTDYVADVTKKGLIKELGLEGKFDNVVIENIKPSLAFNENTLANAYNALRLEWCLAL